MYQTHLYFFTHLQHLFVLYGSQNLEKGTREVVIIQMPTRSGFKEFIAVLHGYKTEGKLEYSLECVSEELYKSAQKVVGCVEESSLYFPGAIDQSPAPSIGKGEGKPMMTTARDEFCLLRVWRSVSTCIFPHACNNNTAV